MSVASLVPRQARGPIVMNMVTWLVVYFVLSFIFTALYVRTVDRSPLTRFFRKHFYCFPAFPILLIVEALLRISATFGRMIFRIMRWIFEKLSGKKTYRRNSSYYRY